MKMAPELRFFETLERVLKTQLPIHKEHELRLEDLVALVPTLPSHLDPSLSKFWGEDKD